MITDNIVFNHNTGNIPTSFGLTAERASEITGSLFFIEIDKTFIAHKLYDNMEDAPKEFTTKTAILSELLDDCNTNAEALFAAYEWGKHLTLSATNKSYKEMTGMLTMMYMISDQDKGKFLKSFVERIGDARSETLGEDDED